MGIDSDIDCENREHASAEAEAEADADDAISETDRESEDKMREDEVRMNRSLKSLFDDDSVNTNSSSNTIEDRDFQWNPPKTHGLDNSRPIIQRWYLEKAAKLGRPVDYTEILLDDIRNMRPLKLSQIEYIKKLDPVDLVTIISTLNDCVKTLIRIADLPCVHDDD